MTKWASEAAMCAALMAEARSRGWLVYPECGADIVLVATDDSAGGNVEAGDVIAVEAKLAANVGVIYQALPPKQPSKYVPMQDQGVADFYAVLVPRRKDPTGFSVVCRRLGITVIVAPDPVETDRDPWDGVFDSRFGTGQISRGPRYDRAGRPRRWVPDLQVDAPAGVPSPRSLTPWKLAAVRFCLAAGSEFTSTDMRRAGINPSTAEAMGWVERVVPYGRPMRLRLVDSPRRPDLVYPEIAEALRRAESER